MWPMYIIGVAGPFVIKYANHMLNEDHSRFSFLIATLRFLFEDVKVATTTVTTWAAEWVIGAVYIDHLAIPIGLDKLPQHPSLALLLGCLGELIAPRLVKWIVNLIPIGKGD